MFTLEVTVERNRAMLNFLQLTYHGKRSVDLLSDDVNYKRAHHLRRLSDTSIAFSCSTFSQPIAFKGPPDGWNLWGRMGKMD